MVHSGSRGIGPAIRDCHMQRAENVGGGLRALDATDHKGTAYLADVAWARRFAEASRRAMADQVEHVVESVLCARLCWETVATTDHNHVQFERHGEREFWVHRKGAMPAGFGQAGVLPGSMGSSSYHVEGRGHEAALCSSAHGAGRALSRAAARAKVTDHEFRRQMHGVWYDYRLSHKLRDEAPAAYKDIKAVLRAQRDLVKVTRMLRPVLNYKGV
jgi:tRNA-splicing ligase RtcB